MPTPSKFTSARREAIIEARRIGASGRLCAQVAGISHTSLQEWLERGRKADEGAYHEFYVEFEKATAEPKMRALGLLWRQLPDKPELNWKFIERQVDGYEPPAPQPAAVQSGPTVIHLSLSGGRPVPRWADVEVIDAQEVPALGDGGGSADPSDADTG